MTGTTGTGSALRIIRPRLIVLTLITIGLLALPLSYVWHLFTHISEINQSDTTGKMPKEDVDVEKDFLLRRKQIKAEILSHDESIFLQVPSVEKATPLILPSAKVLFCPLHKNLHLPVTALLCKIGKETMFPNLDLSDVTDNVRDRRSSLLLTTKCAPKLKLSSWESDEIWRADDWTRMVILRNPFDRVQAIWTKICVQNMMGGDINHCYGSYMDFIYFLEQLFEHFRHIAVAGRVEPDFSAEHFFYPQSWHCSLHKYFDKYNNVIRVGDDHVGKKVRGIFKNDRWKPFVKTGWGSGGKEAFLTSTNFSLTLYRPLRLIDPEEGIHHPLYDPSEVSASENATETDEDADDELDRDLYVADMIFKMYYSDIHYLKFPIPDVVLADCKRTKKSYRVCLYKPPS